MGSMFVQKQQHKTSQSNVPKKIEVDAANFERQRPRLIFLYSQVREQDASS